MDIIKYFLQEMLDHIPEEEKHTSHQIQTCYDELEDLYSIVITLLHNTELYHKAQKFANHHNIIFMYIDLETTNEPYDASILLLDADSGVHTAEFTL